MAVGLLPIQYLHLIGKTNRVRGLLFAHIDTVQNKLNEAYVLFKFALEETRFNVLMKE